MMQKLFPIMLTMSAFISCFTMDTDHPGAPAPKRTRRVAPPAYRGPSPLCPAKRARSGEVVSSTNSRDTAIAHTPPIPDRLHILMAQDPAAHVLEELHMIVLTGQPGNMNLLAHQLQHLVSPQDFLGILNRLLALAVERRQVACVCSLMILGADPTTLTPVLQIQYSEIYFSQAYALYYAQYRRSLSSEHTPCCLFMDERKSDRW